MNELVFRQIAKIHDTPAKLVFEFAGSGSLALYWLHSVAGSSRTVLEASDRYAAPSLADLIGKEPEKFVSQSTAEAMATAAYIRAVRLHDGDGPLFGVALTATIATDRVKRGDHGCWVAVRGRNGLHAYGLTLSKGARDRDGEEQLISMLVIRAIAEASGVAGELPIELIDGEHIEVIETADMDPVALLLEGTAQSVVVDVNGERRAGAPVRGALLSGSFNPLHQGHERLAHTAARVLGQQVTFEIPILNADKPPLSYTELEHRLAQFRFRYPVVLSRAPLFVQKAELFPGCTFVVGYDTAERLVDPRYYDGPAGRDAALTRIRERGCRFLVAGRISKSGTFQTIDALEVPTSFFDLFVGLPESAFRVDMSSTELRARTA